MPRIFARPRTQPSWWGWFTGRRGPSLRLPVLGLFAVFGSLGGLHSQGGSLAQADEGSGSDALAVLARPSMGSASNVGNREGNQATPRDALSIVIGRMGTKAKSGTMLDIPRRLREALLKEIREIRGPFTVKELKPLGQVRNGYSIDASVTRLTRRTTPEGEMEVSCDVSLVIAALPASNVVGMVSGGASVLGPRGSEGKPNQAFVESLESEALSQAVHEAQASATEFLLKYGRR